jgi:phosphate transport system substrate-binding protein
MSKKILLTSLSFLILAYAGYWGYSNTHFSFETSTLKKNTIQKVTTLTLRGSNTVGEKFAPKLAESYLKSLGAISIKTKPLDNPVEKIVEGIIPGDHSLIKIEIKAHGSSTGFKELSASRTEIAMSSRPIKDKEHEALSKSFGQVNEHPIALDALAIISYPSNPINSLTIDQVAAVFSGEIINWSELGGENKGIKLFSRDNNSGTWDTFKSLVLKPRKLKLSNNSDRFESSSRLVKQVIDTDGSLGFVGVAHAGEAKLLAISNNNDSGTIPSGYTIGTQAYPLSRTLYLYTTGTEQTQLADSFITFATRNEGQKEADDAGLVSYYPAHHRPKGLPKQTPRRYKELASIASRITVDFSSDLSATDKNKESRDIARLQNFSKQNPNQSLVLVDFGDSKRLPEIKERLQAKEVSIFYTLNIDYAPMASKNIEVWVF